MKSKKTLIIFSIIIVAIFFISLNSLSAADVNVTNTTSGGIKDAINKVGDNQTINLANGVYSGSNNTGLSITKKLTIRGNGNNVTIDGNKKSIFYISGPSVTFINLKFINCASTIYSPSGHYGTVTIINCSFINNHGFIIDYNGWDLSIKNCSFINNYGYTDYFDGNEGIIKHNGQFLSVANCSFFNNNAGYGAVINCFNQAGNKFINLNISNCSFINNTVSNKKVINANGGLNYGIATLNNCYFYNNSGGALYAYSFAYGISVHNSTFIGNNESSSYYGCIAVTSSSLSVLDCIFINNSDYYGSGVIAYGRSVGYDFIIKNSNFTNNSGGIDDNGAGAIFISWHEGSYNPSDPISRPSSFLIENCNFINNTAMKNGAINIYYLGRGVSMVNYDGIISNCSFINNSGNSGKDIKVIGASILINYCSFVNKDTGLYYSGDFNNSGGYLSVQNTVYPTKILLKELELTKNKPTILTVTLIGDKPISGQIIYFYVNNIPIGYGITNEKGEAFCEYVSTVSGNLLLKASYEGDGYYNPSIITSFFTVKDPIKQSTAITMNNFNGVYNKVVKLSATLKSDNIAVSDKIVKFYVNGVYIGQNRTNSKGIATYNYKITSTGSLSVKTVFSEDSQYTSSSKTNTLTIPKLSEIKIKNIAQVKGKTAKITNTIANLGYNKGTFKLTFKLAKGLTYKKPKVSTGKITYSKKTRTLTWTITNLKIHRTKSATITWNLKAKKGNYSLIPKLVKNNSIRLLSNNQINFRIK